LQEQEQTVKLSKLEVWDSEGEKFIEVDMELTVNELVAAIIETSLGSETPSHALAHVLDYLGGGTKAYCSWGALCYKGDLETLIRHSAQMWYYQRPERRIRLLSVVERWRELEKKDWAASTAFGLFWPTHV